MADPVTIADKISKQAAADTGKQHSQFENLAAAIKQVTETLRKIFLLPTQDKERYNAALTAPRAPTIAAPGGEISVPEPE